jgi:predicted  nucleic acid-binding Zn-ribbon protein
MRLLLSLALACCIVNAFAADIPVAEIKLDQDTRQHAQLKTDFAFKEMQRAEWSLEAAEKDAAEAERAYQQAQRQAEEARQRLADARQKMEKSRAALQEARRKWDAESQIFQREPKPASSAKPKP